MKLFSQNSGARDTFLIEAVRAEIRAGVEPLARDMAGLKEAVERVERQQQAVYTKEVTDLKFKERDERLEALEGKVKKLQEGFGALWQNTFIRVAFFVGLAASALNFWDLLTRHLP